MNFRDINTTLPEGMLLMAALGMLTGTTHTNKTPEQVTDELSALAAKMYADQPPLMFNQDRGWEVAYTAHRTLEADTREQAVQMAEKFEYMVAQNFALTIIPTSFHNCLDGHTHEVIGWCELSGKPIFEDDEFRVEGDIMYLVAENDPENMQEVFEGLDEEPNGIKMDLLSVNDAAKYLPERLELSYQERVYQWLVTCFNEGIAYDKAERIHRFTEEALELAQAAGCSREDACTILNSVFGKRPGQIAREAGQVMVTLAGVCISNAIQMDAEGENELQRLWGKIEEKRAKHAAKVPGSPLAGVIDNLDKHIEEAATLVKDDANYLPWLHELTTAGYERGIVIPADHSEAIASIYILGDKTIAKSLDDYQRFLVRWNALKQGAE